MTELNILKMNMVCDAMKESFYMVNVKIFLMSHKKILLEGMQILMGIGSLYLFLSNEFLLALVFMTVAFLLEYPITNRKIIDN